MRAVTSANGPVVTTESPLDSDALLDDADPHAANVAIVRAVKAREGSRRMTQAYGKQPAMAATLQ